MLEECNICSCCHKSLTIDMFKRMNYKQTGQERLFKICNECNLTKLKKKVALLDSTNKFKILSVHYNKADDE